MVRYSIFDIILFVFFSARVTGQYGNCTGQLDTINDGKCDIENNAVECGYDGGDCCECNCMNDRHYPCGIWGFNCSDPAVLGNAGGCQNETSSIRTCSSDASKTWLVNDTASARSLAEAVNCSRGTFNVTWRGSVLVKHTMYIPDGTTLYLTGEGSGAEVNGGGKIRLFMPVGADLYIDGLILSNGNATYGGAIAATRSSVFLNQTLCSGNIASSYGGAIFVGMNSTLAWEGQTTLTGNHAGLLGGAVAISTSSIASWNGVTSFTNNTAQYGGAVAVNMSSLASWSGPTEFSLNSAVGNSGFGGAVYVNDHSTVSWDGLVSFTENMAFDNGGALCVYSDSIVSWNGVTSYVNNTAEYGGALYVYQSSNLLWAGVTSFTENNAISSGGAIYVAKQSRVTVGGDTYFLENEAGIDGGAAYIYTSDDDETSLYFIVDNNVTLRFQKNTCGTNGGAIAIIGGVVTSFPPNVTYLENAAGINGGAIYMSSVHFGMRFEGAIFISNSAVIGGGVYSTGSGIAVAVNGRNEYNPTTFIGCEFIGNMATKTGGAMNSDTGRDTILNTSFVRNKASAGGALKLVSTTALIGCRFLENVSGEDGGPGIFNDGVISKISRCSFIDNVFDCQAGFFLDYKENAFFDAVCKGCDTRCRECKIKGKEPMCLKELEHSSSVGGNSILESLLIEPGYWRATNTSINILACYNAEACLGGFTGERDYCGKGYEGPFCAVCSKRYTPSLAFACNKCSDDAAGGIALAVVMVVVFLLAVTAFLSYMLSGEVDAADQGIVAHVTRFIPLQSVKIIIVVWQILTQFATVANVVFPNIYQTFLDGVDILNFDLSWVLSVRCIIHTDFHDQLLLATLGPLVCMAILGGTYVAAMNQIRASEEARGIIRRKHVSMVLLLTFLIYSSVSSTLFKTFACDDLDDGKNYLRADYRIVCNSSKHKALEIYAGFMIILYVVGIPSFYGVLLYNNREALMKNVGREEDESVKFMTDLWNPYRPDRFYYEVIECVRRVLLTGALVFIYPNTAAQIAVAFMVATFFIFVSEALAPYASPWDTWSSRTGHAIVFTSIFLALLLKVDVSGERANSQGVFGSVLIAAHSCLILVVAVEAVTMVAAWRKEVKEDIQP